MTIQDTSNAADLTEQMRRFDLYKQEHRDIKWELFDNAREKCPVAHTTAPTGEFFVLTRYEDIRGVLEDWETWSSTEVSPVPTGISLCPIDVDPPKQATTRKLLNPLFSRRALAPYEPIMRAVAKEYIAKWVERGSVEILNEFAGPYIGTVLTQVVFENMSDEELERARRVASAVAEEATPEVFAELYMLGAEFLAKAKERGTSGSGVLATLLSTDEVDGQPLTDEDRTGVLGILVLGGLDTSRAAIGSIVYRMSQDSSIEGRLRDPGWVRRDFDEFIRLDSPVGTMCRVATKDTELNGVPIKKGQRVQVRFDAANRDPAKFSNPHKLSFDEVRTGHAGFGMGVHRCIGSNLARLQIEIAFEELLAQVTNIRLAPDQEIRWVPGNSNALHPFTVKFDRV